MLFTKLKIATALLLAVGSLITGAGILAHPSPAAQEPEAQKQEVKAPPAEGGKSTLVDAGGSVGTRLPGVQTGNCWQLGSLYGRPLQTMVRCGQAVPCRSGTPRPVPCGGRCMTRSTSGTPGLARTESPSQPPSTERMW